MGEIIKYSFIIPHKNSPELLQRCINSIPQREDVQIVVVDDNSDNGKKPQIARENLEIVLLDAEHSKGAGRARNVGLEHAKGSWLLFADADDYYTNNLSQLMDTFATDNKTDIVYLNACMIDENEKTTPHPTELLIRNYQNSKKNAELELRYTLWTPWSRMVRKSLVDANKLQFDEIPACNDKMFGLQCSKFAKTIEVFNDVVYYYYRPTFNSATDKLRNKDMFDSILDVRGRTILLYKEVSFKPNTSFLDLIVPSTYRKGLSLLDLLSKYRFFLKKYNVSCLIDICRFLISKLH